jgi:hypothetical protein
LFRRGFFFFAFSASRRSRVFTSFAERARFFWVDWEEEEEEEEKEAEEEEEDAGAPSPSSSVSGSSRAETASTFSSAQLLSSVSPVVEAIVSRVIQTSTVKIVYLNLRFANGE